MNDFSGLGSACLAIPVLRAMEAAAPRFRYSYPDNALAGDARVAPLLGLRGLVDWHPPHWRRFEWADRYAIAEYLTVNGFDMVIDFRNPSVAADSRALEFRSWYEGRGARLRWYDLRDWPIRVLACRHVQDRMIALLGAAGVTAGRPQCGWLARRRDGEVVAGASPDANLPVVGIFPSAASAVKRWPSQGWTAVAARVLAELDAEVVVISGSDHTEQRSAVAVFDHLRETTLADRVHLHPPGSVGDLVDLLSALTVVATNDTGVAHLADACGVPTVVVFVATEASVWAPPSPLSRQRQSLVGRACPLQRPAQGNCALHYGECEAPCHAGVTVDQVVMDITDALRGAVRRAPSHPTWA